MKKNYRPVANKFLYGRQNFKICYWFLESSRNSTFLNNYVRKMKKIGKNLEKSRKMVKHTQTNQLFECVWPFYEFGA